MPPPKRKTPAVRPPREKPAHTRTFTCALCEHEFPPPVTPDGLKSHFATEHGLDPDRVGAAPGRLVMALDGDDYTNVHQYFLDDKPILTRTDHGPKEGHYR